jgi:hypothetical protein
MRLCGECFFGGGWGEFESDKADDGAGVGFGGLGVASEESELGEAEDLEGGVVAEIGGGNAWAGVPVRRRVR